MKTVSNFPSLQINTNFNEPRSQTHNQRQSHGHHPIRPYKRFIPTMVADSGISSSKCIENFMNNELIKPYPGGQSLTYKQTSPNSSMDDRRDKWALNTQVICSTEGNLPKVQQYKSLYFPQRDSSSVDKYRNTFLKTDNIAIKTQQNIKEQLKDNTFGDNFLKMKAKYNFHSETKNGWAPKTYNKSVGNKSSVNYNIISFNKGEGNLSNTAGVLERKLINKKKAIGEYSDLTKTYRTNFNKDYTDAIEKNKHIFYNYTGIFTN